MELDELIERVHALPQRHGARPSTQGPAPHQQIDQYPARDDLRDLLHEFAVGLTRVEAGASHIGDGGLRAYFLAGDSSVGFTPRFLVDNELGHIHRHPSHSLHLVLPEAIGAVVDARGWAERHPLALAGRIPRTNHLVYGARDEEELEVTKVLLGVAHALASGRIDP